MRQPGRISTGLFPRWDEPRPWGKRVLIAWKEARESARAVHDAAPLLKRAETVCIVAVQHGAHADRSVERSTERLIRHLGRFGVTAESRVVLTDQPDGSALLEQAERRPADLLVMGGYGHSPLRELVFGGATRTAIRQSRIPVLLSH